MTEPLFRVENLRLSLPDMTRKPLFGAAPRVEILKGLSFDNRRRLDDRHCRRIRLRQVDARPRIGAPA